MRESMQTCVIGMNDGDPFKAGERICMDLCVGVDGRCTCWNGGGGRATRAAAALPVRALHVHAAKKEEEGCQRHCSIRAALAHLLSR